MDQFYAVVEVDDEELSAILKKLNAAQEILYECYKKLQELNVLKLKKADTASGN